MKILRLNLFLFWFLSFVLLPVATVKAETRLALVIGVSDYGQNSLSTPAKDAALMSSRLRALNFDVSVPTVSSRGKIRDAVNALHERLNAIERDSVVVFYFAGHAVQFGGENYLIPAGAKLDDKNITPGDYDDQAVRAQWILDKLTESQARGLRVLFILDACRNNPFGGSPGLAELSARNSQTDTMIAFSTMPGALASDGSGNNSLYTATLAEQLNGVDVTLTQVFERTSEIVKNHPLNNVYRQRPYAKGSLLVRLKESPRSSETVAELGSKLLSSGSSNSSSQPLAGQRRDLNDARFFGGEAGKDLLDAELKKRSLKEISDGAALGNVSDLYFMGHAHWIGAGGLKADYNKAMHYMRLAAVRGSGRAANAIGALLCCDEAGPKNLAEAHEWYVAAASVGAPQAYRNLGIEHRDGEVVPRDIAEAERLLLKAATSGFDSAWYDLVTLYETDTYRSKDSIKARKYLELGAKAGHPGSITGLASQYEWGTPPDRKDKDTNRALAILHEGAVGRCRECWYRIGQIHSGTDLGEPDLEVAFQAYSNGDAVGDVDSSLEMARALRSGSGTEKNLALAYAAAERAYALGSPDAGGLVGQALAKGEGVAADAVRAASLLRPLLARDKSKDPNERHAVYQPNYWAFALDLGNLIEKKEILPAYPTELAELRARYGKGGGLKRFTVPVDCGGLKVPFHIYILDWTRLDDETPVDSQAEWLKSQRGCTISEDVIDAFRKLKKIARENGRSFMDLSVEALGTVPKETPAESPK